MTDLQNELHNFTGTEHWYQHSLMRNVLYTDGVKYLAEHAHAYWLIDKIASLQLEPKIKAEDFQVWKLQVDKSEATLTATDGDKGDGPVCLHNEHINYTDFPLDSIELWVEPMDERRVCILLPSEH